MQALNRERMFNRPPRPRLRQSLVYAATGARMASASLSHRAAATLSQLYSCRDVTPTGLCRAFGNRFLLRCHPYGALPCIWKQISTKMSPLRGWAVRFVKQNKPFKNRNLRNPVSSYMILEWQGGC